MTSLSTQLKKLKRAPTRALAVERDYSSLLFNKKEAGSYDKDDFYKIGLLFLGVLKNFLGVRNFFENSLKILKFFQKFLKLKF